MADRAGRAASTRTGGHCQRSPKWWPTAAGTSGTPLVVAAGAVPPDAEPAAAPLAPWAGLLAPEDVAAELPAPDGEEADGFVTGVMVTPVTLRLSSALFFLLSVPRAMRVARALAVAAALASTDKG